MCSKRKREVLTSKIEKTTSPGKVQSELSVFKQWFPTVVRLLAVFMKFF